MLAHPYALVMSPLGRDGRSIGKESLRPNVVFAVTSMVLWKEKSSKQREIKVKDRQRRTFRFSKSYNLR